LQPDPNSLADFDSPIMITATDSTISPELMLRYGDLIYQVTGIRIPPQKQALLTNRVRRRLKATGIDDFASYLLYLQKLKPAHPEWDLFLQEITTHETYLFRDEPQWAWLKNNYLPALAAQADKGERTRSLRIWSAACSTGDEAYTTAICLAEGFKPTSPWTIKIIGTDIGIGAVTQARQAALATSRLAKRQSPFEPDPNSRNGSSFGNTTSSIRCWNNRSTS
jgi:chemotaxis protein methyltransferase CheR